jgi:alkylated DNA repair protein (DNA oxidative demethylase)
MTFVDQPSANFQDGGFHLYPGFLDASAQADLRDEVLAAVASAPFYRPATPGGGCMSVEVTGMGAVAWTSDSSGYRYASRHPLTGRAWPAIPTRLVDIWTALAGAAIAPDSCLVNFYGPGARMGLHQDRDEADLTLPVLSVSLGDTAIFRIGGRARRGPTRSVRLASGDVCILSGDARLAFHGVDRIIPGSSRLLSSGGRLNLTLRCAGQSGSLTINNPAPSNPAPCGTSP